MKRHIRGFQNMIDTGDTPPVTCKAPRYGPHEAAVITRLVNELEDNGLIEDDDGPWGALIVLAGKPNQAHKHWTEYVWRLCVSYRKLNTVTRPYLYPTRRCDDAVTDLGKALFFIAMDLAWGYWQVYLHPTSRPKTAFFVPGGKKRWTGMPMGATNSHAAFCAMMDKMKVEWDGNFAARAQQRYGRIPFVTAEVIVDDVLLAAESEEVLLWYFEEVLKVLMKYRVTVNLKKCRFFTKCTEFVGVDVSGEGNAPAKSKFDDLQKMTANPPRTATDLLAIIGFFGFYQEWLPWYEVRIKRWREYKQSAPRPTAPREEQETYMAEKWTSEDSDLLKTLTQEIMKSPIRKRPDFDRRFYLKTDWSRLGMGAVLLQADTTQPEAREAEQREQQDGVCRFDRTKQHTPLRLKPISMISRRCTGTERNYHSNTGEIAAGVWAVHKFKRYLFGRRFTWLTDCTGAKAVFEQQYVPTHQMERWKQKLLCFDFTIVHRPARMVAEVDMLSRYNLIAERLRDTVTTAETTTTPTGWQLLNQLPMEVNSTARECTVMAATASRTRQLWIIGAATYTGATHPLSTGGKAQIAVEIEPEANWNVTGTPGEPQARDQPYLGIQAEDQQHLPAHCDWVGICCSPTWDRDIINGVVHIGTMALQRGATSIVIWHATAIETAHDICRQLHDKQGPTWTWSHRQITATAAGAAIEGNIKVHIMQRTTQRIPIHHSDPEPRKSMTDVWGQHEDGTRAMTQEQEPTDTAQSPRHYERRATPEFFAAQDGEWVPIFAEHGPAPNMGRDQEIQWQGHPFATARGCPRKIHPVTQQEVLMLMGMPPSKQAHILAAQGLSAATLRNMVPVEVIDHTWDSIAAAEDQQVQGATNTPARHDQPVEVAGTVWTSTTSAGKTIPAQDLRLNTTLPLPDAGAWADATEGDDDIKTARTRLKGAPAEPKGKERLTEEAMAYATEIRYGRLEEEEGILYRYEVGARKAIRQLRTRVVPKMLRPVIITACHASPFAGHSDVHKTLWRAAAHYWWPKMARDIKEAVAGCGHCRAVNATSKENQQLLKTVTAQQPFDIMACDAWSPGRIPSRSKSPLPPAKAILTTIDIMTGFVITAELHVTDSHEIARMLISQVVTRVGLPQMIMVDAGSEFAGTVINVCELLKIHYHAVTRENHKAILAERFHRYLNKVQRIHADDCTTIDDWAQGVSLATYAWNAGPVDGTNITRSSAAIGREFALPIQIAEHKPPTPGRWPQNWGQLTLEYTAGAFPLLYKQRQLLKILIEERRAHHRDLKNKHRQQNVFTTGDLVLVRKQVLTSQEKGPAKLQLRARGPYRVLDKVSENTYTLIRLPFHPQERHHQFKAYKESAARMEKLPSTMVLHGRSDGTDDQWATLHCDYTSNPLSSVYGHILPGRYRRAPANKDWAFEPIEELWQETIDATSDDHSGEPRTQTPHRPTTAAPQEQPNEHKRTREDDATPASTIPPATRHSKRRAGIPSRYRQDDRTPKELATVNRAEKVKASRNKLCLAWVPQPKPKPLRWILGRVVTPSDELSSTTSWKLEVWHRQTRANGTKDSAFWPSIRHPTKGPTFVRPAKLTQFILNQPQHTKEEIMINIHTQWIYGPFNFVPPPHANTNAYTIPERAWKHLRTYQGPRPVDLTHVPTAPP